MRTTTESLIISLIILLFADLVHCYNSDIDLVAFVIDRGRFIVDAHFGLISLTKAINLNYFRVAHNVFFNGLRRTLLESSIPSLKQSSVKTILY